jgi:hypothetical protein
MTVLRILTPDQGFTRMLLFADPANHTGLPPPWEAPDWLTERAYAGCIVILEKPSTMTLTPR